MILGKKLKQPNEVKDYDIDFSPWINSTGDTLDNLEISIICLDDELDTSLKCDRHFITEDQGKLWISGGTSGYVYKLTVIAATVGGVIDESELIFAVEDI